MRPRLPEVRRESELIFMHMELELICMHAVYGKG